MSPLKHTQWLSLLTLMSAGCTLDFDEFEPYTEEALRRQAMQDMEPPPPEEDMIVPIEDMEPPPPPVDIDPPVIDSDGDGVLDDTDNCVDLSNPDQRDDNANMIGDACEDRDGDGVLDYRYDFEAPTPYTPYDNCIEVMNPDQRDLDWDGVGDACDPDADGDNLDVNAEMTAGTDPLKADSDLDGWRDDVDLCPLTTSRDNRDLDGDGVGDECDADDDGDMVYDWLDNCPYAPNPEQTLAEGSSRGAECLNDADNDGVLDADDPCPFEPNPEGAPTSTCALNLTRWGFDGDHYDLALKEGAAELWAATRGGLRTLSDDPSLELSFGEEDGLWSRYVKRVALTDGTHSAAWLLTDSDEGVNVLRWDSTLGRYWVQPVELRAQGVSGELTSIAAWGDEVYVGSTEGLYALNSSGLISFELPSPTQYVNSLTFTDEGVLIVASGATLYMRDLEGALVAVGTYDAAGNINRLKQLSTDQLALLGDAATLLINLPTPGVVAEVTQTINYTATDVISRPDGLYLATSEGVRWVDGRGRAYAPNTDQVGSSVTRALARDEAQGRFWVGAQGAATEAYGLWSGLSVPDESCVRDLYLEAGEYWWVATDTSLSSLNPDGTKTTHAEGSFYALARSGEGVWSATSTEVIYASRAAGALSYPLTDALNAGFVGPVTAVELINDQLWLGGVSTLAYTTLNNNAPTTWTVLNAVDHANLNTGVVKGIRAQGPYIRVALEGDGAGLAGGLCRYNPQLGQFDQPPYTNVGGGLPSYEINDFTSDGDDLAVSTTFGARVYDFTNPATPQLSNLSPNAGLPGESGSSDTLSMTFTSAYAFVMVRPNALQPYGALLRFGRGVNNPLDITNVAFFSSAETDPLTVPAADFTSARLRTESSADGVYPYVSMATCGSEAYPGHITVLDSEGGVRQRVPERSLKRPSEGYALIPSPGEHLTWAQSDALVEGGAKLYLTDLALVDPNNLNIGEPRGRRAVEAVSYGLRMCRRYKLQPADPTGRVECLLEDNYVASNLNESWNQSPTPLFDGQPIEVRSFVIDPTQLATGRFYATDQGLIQKRGVNFISYTNATTEGGLPSDNLYAVAYNTTDQRLYLGMDSGLVSFPIGGAVNVPVEAWVQVEELKGVKVYDLAVASGGEVWAATRYGLVKLSAEGVTRYGLSQGLPSEKVTKVAVSEAGVVAALHESGLSVYKEGQWRHFGPQRGVERGATELMIVEPAEPGGAEYVWVGGALGATKLKVDW